MPANASCDKVRGGFSSAAPHMTLHLRFTNFRCAISSAFNGLLINRLFAIFLKASNISWQRSAFNTMPHTAAKATIIEHHSLRCKYAHSFIVAREMRLRKQFTEAQLCRKQFPRKLRSYFHAALMLFAVRIKYYLFRAKWKFRCKSKQTRFQLRTVFVT